MSKYAQNRKIENQKIQRQQDIVMDVLYEQEVSHHERGTCSARYTEWKRSHTPLFLFSGATNMQSVLPFLNFFWPESNMTKRQYASNKRKQRDTKQYSIVEHDLGSQVDLYALVSFPKIDTDVFGCISTYSEWFWRSLDDASS